MLKGLRRKYQRAEITVILDPRGKITDDMTDKRNNATREQHRKGMTQPNKKVLVHISSVKDIEGRAYAPKAGTEAPTIVTTVPENMVHDEEALGKTRTVVEALLGESQVTIFMTRGTGPTGEILICCSAISEVGAGLLKQGWCWRPAEPVAGDVTTDDRGFYAYKGQMGGSDKAAYASKNDNSIEFRWDPRQKTVEGNPCPSKSRIYSVVEQCEKSMYLNRVGLIDKMGDFRI